MGARPVALLDGLRFGGAGLGIPSARSRGSGTTATASACPTSAARRSSTRPTPATASSTRCASGSCRPNGVTRAKAQGTGNALVLYGATTGRDGIGGASVLASQELGEGSEEKRPSVQVGDPFTGKKLIEVSLELVESGLVESLQDCGAAGLASALSEMARGGAGVDVHLDRVPLREEGMEPWEIMISESQERMVAVVRPEMLERVEAVLDRWELHARGHRRGDRHRGAARLLRRTRPWARSRREYLTDECPRYEVEQRVSRGVARARRAPSRARRRSSSSTTSSSGRARFAGRGSTQRCSSCGLRCAGLAVSLDGPPLGCRDPREAGRAAVLDAARNVACAGGEPIGAHRLPQLRQPREGRDRLGARRRRSRASPRLRRRSGFRSYRATCRSTTRPTDARFLRRRSSAASGSCATCGRSRAAGSPATRPALLEGDEVELISWLWKAAPRLSLAHDVSDGGLAEALAEAAAWSAATTSRPTPRRRTGRSCVAGAECDWPRKRELGVIA